MQNASQVIQGRKERERRQRIQSIMAAAKRVFFDKGYTKTTMDAIALEAEITKPTVYQYFETKEDLFFSLMTPVIEEIGRQLEEVERRAAAGGFRSGRLLIRALFQAMDRARAMDPDAFRMIQLFQQSGLIGQLGASTREALNRGGKSNFELGRRILRTGMRQGLIKRTSPHELLDVIWGAFAGIVQLEAIKSQKRPQKQHLERTLKLAERMVVSAVGRAPDKQ